MRGFSTAKPDQSGINGTMTVALVLAGLPRQEWQPRTLVMSTVCLPRGLECQVYYSEVKHTVAVLVCTRENAPASP